MEENMEYVFAILAIVAGVELGFCIWGLVTGGRHDTEKAVVRIGEVILMLLFLIAGILKDFSRYKMFMGILVVQLLLYGIAVWRQKKKGTTKKFSKGKAVGVVVGNFFLYGTCLMPAFMFPQYEEPQVTGEHEVLLAEYTWVDESRIETYTDTGENRAVTVKFWYPKEEGKYPLVVFSHGAFGIIDSNYSTCMELASNGYVVVSVAHPYHAMFVEDVNGKTTFADMEFVQKIYTENGTTDPETERRIYEHSREWMAVRVGDLDFVLNQILEKADSGEDAPFQMIDVEKIGLFGHSMGGAASVHMGRVRNDIDAVIDLEGTMFGEYVDFQNGTEVFNEEVYRVPVLDVNSSDVDRQARELEEMGYSYVNFYLGERATDYQYKIIEGAGHLNFTDLPMVSPILAGMLGAGEVDAKECIEEINAMVLQFFNEYLKEE